MQKESCKYLIDASLNSVSYAEIFTTCTGINIEENPQLLWFCEKCETKLVDFYKFRLKCTQSYTFLTSKNVPVFEFIDLKPVVKEEPKEEPTNELFINDTQECEDLKYEDETDVYMDKIEDIEDNEDLDIPLIKLVKNSKRDSPKKSKNITQECEDQSEGNEEADVHMNVPLIQLVKNTKSYLPKKEKTKRVKKTPTFTCKFCPKTFGQHSSKVLHERRYHTKEKPYVCVSGCEDRSFYSKSEFNLHMSRNHNPDKKYECKTCLRKFSVRKDLSLHLPMHTLEKAIQCELCGQQFARKTSLSHHIQRHIRDLEPKIPCKLCDKTFPKKFDLWKHVRENHKFDHTCDFCERVFETAVNLRAHRKVHAVKKAHPCPVCPTKSFCENHQLRRHLRDSHPGMELPPVIESKNRQKNLVKYVAMLGDEVPNV